MAKEFANNQIYLLFCMRINLTGIFGSWTGRFRVKYREKVMAVAVQASEQKTIFLFEKVTAHRIKYQLHLKTKERVGESFTSNSLSRFSRYLK